MAGPKLALEGVHSLGCRVRGLVEAKVELRDADQEDGGEEGAVEGRPDGEYAPSVSF